MTEFFKSWRRKIGIATLALASLFATGWVRSSVFEDFVIRIAPDDIIGLTSHSRGISWTRFTPYESEQFKVGWRFYSIEQKLLGYGDAYNGYNVLWRWRCAGFDFGARQDDDYCKSLVDWTIPYWAVTIPLTITSAWLLLFRPRKPVHSQP
jgi:hypothetical protein